MKHLIVRAPLRVSFFGGGSDVPDFLTLRDGAVVATAIDKYVYVSVKAHSSVFGEKFRLSYSQTESAQDRSNIRNDIIRGALEILEIDEPLQVTTWADLPSGTGLGSSSSFAVAILKALTEIIGTPKSVGEVAELACELELNHLGRAMGRQDQYAAAFGGLNLFKFSASETLIRPLSFERGMGQVLAGSRLIWTGVQRDASEEGLKSKGMSSATRVLHLERLADQALRFAENLELGISASEFAEQLNSAWETKRKTLTEQSPEIERTYRKCMDLGVSGAKLLGAGGGGFFFVIAQQEVVRKLDMEFGVASIPIGISKTGVEVIHFG